jgi:hypothetical protein
MLNPLRETLRRGGVKGEMKKDEMIAELKKHGVEVKGSPIIPILIQKLKDNGLTHILPDRRRTEQADVPALNIIKSTLETPKVQAELKFLYKQSQSEHTRNEKLKMEVGSAREADFITALYRNLSGVEYQIDNKHTEDFTFMGELVSLKHISAVVGSGSIKLEWTADNECAETCMKTKDVGKTHIIMTFVDTKKNSAITIVCVTKDMINKIVNDIGRDKALKSSTGKNNRGVAFTGLMVKSMVEHNYFKVVLKDIDLSGGLDPIQRRMKDLDDKFGPADRT